MALILSPENAHIFRITHRDNVPWILDHGLHAKNGSNHDANFHDIGNADLIDKRSRRTVSVGPGGNLSDYVPFYFTPYSIMMYNIHTGWGVKRVASHDIVILVSSLHHIASCRIPFVFTNQHAYPPMAEYFADLAQLDRLDWPLLQSGDFKHDPDDPGRKERYQAEALIWRHVPLEALKGICCYDANVEDQINAAIQVRGLQIKVVTQQSWYF